MFLGWEVHIKSLYIVIAKLFPNRFYTETKSIIPLIYNNTVAGSYGYYFFYPFDPCVVLLFKERALNFNTFKDRNFHIKVFYTMVSYVEKYA